MIDLQKQFEDHKLFRRLLVVFVCFMTYVVTDWSFYFANEYAGTITGVEMAAVIAAVHAPITALTGYLSKLYWEKSK